MAVITGDIATTRDADRIGRHGCPRCRSTPAALATSKRIRSRAPPTI